MRYGKLGRTGLKVSTFCLGSATYGFQVDTAEATNVVRAALAAGVNFFDTADHYAEGRSEEIIGQALEQDRHSVVLATKVGIKTGPAPNDSGLSRRHILQGAENSLRRLRTDYIDLYYAHVPDYDTPIDETLKALDDLVRQGKVRYVGCSNFRAWQLAKALWVSDLNNLARFECTQPPYNLVTRDVEYELLPLCGSEGVGVCVYNPLAGGLLTGKYEQTKPPAEGTKFALEQIGPRYLQRYWSAANFNAVARLRQVAENHGCSLAQFALAWTLTNPTVTAAVCGATSGKQLEENLRGTELRLSEEELNACDSIWDELRPSRFSYGR